MMKNQEIIYEHYEKTCEICRNNEKNRNALFIKVCILMTLLFLFMKEERSVLEMIQKYIYAKFNFNLTLSIEIIQSMIWLLLLFFTVRYYQLCIGIERLYKYIHGLEEKMCTGMNLGIEREGKRYLQNYPWILNFIWGIYTIVFPILFLLLVVVKLVVEYRTNSWNWNLCLNSVLGGCNITLTLTYLIFLQKEGIRKLLHISL